MSEQTPGCAEPARFFILNLGRCGSSLLSAVLADAGAQFGLPVPAGWDPRTGQMESPAIKRAAHHYRRAHDISEGRKFVLSPMLEQKFRLQRARQALRDALAVSRYVKIGDLDLVVQPAFKLGYEPVVILNYRQLEPMLPSLLAGRTHVGPDELAREYVRIYRQGLMLLDTFGGCTVEFNDLLDPGAQSWATALAGVTGLDAERLLEARARHLRGEPDPENVTALYTEAHALLALMRARRGLRIPRARQVQRAIDARR